MKILYKNSFSMILVVAILFIGHVAISQEVLIQQVTKNGFQGVNNMGKEGYYVQFEESNSEGKKVNDIYRLVVLNNDLGIIGDFKLSYPLGENMEDVAYNGEVFMISTGNKKSKTRTYVILDKNGAEKARYTSPELSKQVLEMPVFLITGKSKDFIVLSAIKDKKVGYCIEKFNDKLESAYKKDVVADKNQLVVVDYILIESTLYVLENSKTFVAEYFDNRISAYEIGTGEQKFTHPLKNSNGSLNGHATSLKNYKDEGVVVYGTAYTGNIYFDQFADGYFVGCIKSDGSQNVLFKKWKEVAEKISDYVTFQNLVNMNQIVLHDLVMKDGGKFYLVGEIFKVEDHVIPTTGANQQEVSQSGQPVEPPSYKKTTVVALLTLEFDNDFNLNSVKTVNQLDVRALVKITNSGLNKPSNDQRSNVNIGKVLNAKGAFPYRFNVYKNASPIAVNYYHFELKFTEELRFVNLNDGTEAGASVDITQRHNFVNRQKQEKVNKTAENISKYVLNDKNYDTEINNFELTNTDDPNNLTPKFLKSRISPANVEGKIVVYDLEPTPEVEADEKAYAKWLNRYEINAEGNLKLSYVSIN